MPTLHKYGHYLNDTTFSAVLVKRHMLSTALSHTIKQRMGCLNQMQVDVTEVYAALVKFPGVDKDKHTSHTYKYLNESLEEVRKLAACVCGVSILYETSGEAQVTQATKFLLKRRSIIPTMLAGMLDGLTGEVQPCKRQRLNKKVTMPAIANGDA